MDEGKPWSFSQFRAWLQREIASAFAIPAPLLRDNTGTKSDLTALRASDYYGHLRPTNEMDVAQLDWLAERGLMDKGSGPVKGDARCGYYWIINDAGRKELAKSTG